jgi:alkylation response protein AidB-like acyl-CoA dehydrogenase
MSETLVFDAAERLFADLATPAVVNAAEVGTWPGTLWDAVASAGFLDALGDGAKLDGLANAAAVLHAAGRYAVPLPIADTMLARWLLKRARMTAPVGPLALIVESGDVRLDLRRARDGWHLSCEVNAVPWARLADALVVVRGDQIVLARKGEFAADDGRNLAGEPADTVSIDRDFPGAAVGSTPEGADAVAAYRLGALLRAAEMAGALEAALQLAVTYANDRVQFGRPIGKFQAIQQELALAAEQVAAAGVAASASVAGAAAGDLAFAAASAKLRAGEAAGKVADIVHQVHGAIGFTHEHRLHHLTRRLWSWRDEFGHENFWAVELGRLVVAQGPDGLWPFLAAR